MLSLHSLHPDAASVNAELQTRVNVGVEAPPAIEADVVSLGSGIA